MRARRCGAAVAIVAALLASTSTTAIAAQPLRSSTDPGAPAAPDTVARALRANVVIEAVLPDGRRSVAAGVILELERGVASIATARHAVDGGFPGLATSEADAPIELAVVGRDDARLPLAVEWRAPHGIDLAIVSARLTDGALRAARCDRNVAPHAGDEVFAVGNPGSVASRHVAGTLTHVRDQQKGGYEFQMLQSNAALTPGYSGGGLYDAHGRLIGINTMGGLPLGDQRFPNGVGLAITLRTLLELAPSRIRCDFGNANG